LIRFTQNLLIRLIRFLYIIRFNQNFEPIVSKIRWKRINKGLKHTYTISKPLVPIVGHAMNTYSSKEIYSLYAKEKPSLSTELPSF